MFAKRSITRLVFITLVLASLFFSSLGTTPVYAAGINVNTNADNVANDGFCTLREAIATANSDSAIYPDPTPGECAVGFGADSITFDGDYTITLAGAHLPVVTSSIFINGNGAANTIIQANTSPDTATYRVFSVSGSSATLVLYRLTVRHGRCTGGCAINGLWGGAIYNNSGTLTVADSSISENTGSYGGGIFNDGGILTVINSTLAGNRAIFNGGGVYIRGQSRLDVIDSTISGNNAGREGGGIWSEGGALTMTGSTISGNTATEAGGGMHYFDDIVTLTNSLISGNSGGSGGGIYNVSGRFYNVGLLTITNSTITENIATFHDGGGIVNINGRLDITNSTISDNNAGRNGGGISNQQFDFSNTNIAVMNSTLSGNSAFSEGGGIYNQSNVISIAFFSNSTVSQNDAAMGGGIYDAGVHSNVVFTNSTLSGNSAATSGGGIFIEDGFLHFGNTIIANSTSGGDCIIDAGGMSTHTNGLVEDGSCSATYSGDPRLGPLANNGGPTQTMALLAGSPAIDTGDDTICANADINNLDQRGVTRPQGAHCDIGAFEYEYKAPTDIQLSASTIAENLPADTTVGTLATIDPDSGDTHTYSFCGGMDDASFVLTGNALNTAATFDFEVQNRFQICIRTTDAQGWPFDKAFEIIVIDMPETIAPETTIIAMQVKRSGRFSGNKFIFASSASNSTFMCRLDQAEFSLCTNPTSYSGLSAGSHTFQVYAVDPSGNPDLTPAEYQFTVNQ